VNNFYRVPLFGVDGVRGNTLVSGDDLDWVLAHRWMLSARGYVIRHCRLGPGRQTKVLLHRELLGLPRADSRQGDHINRDRLDNRRENLRIVTSAQNAQNKPGITKTSAFRGVCWDAGKGKWRAQAGLAGKRYHLGRFADEEEAAAVAAGWRRVHMPWSVEEAA
jgi:hypothetical protein